VTAAGFSVQSCLIAYASRLDAKLPPASAEIFLAYAKALADRQDPALQGLASFYVHLAATDAASLETALKRCGLDGVKPAVATRNDRPGWAPAERASLETMQTIMRVALLHPANSSALLESLGNPPSMDPTASPLLPLLQEPELRKRISPELFLKWNRHLAGVEQKNLESMKLYSTERRADFDEARRTELDGLLKRLDNPEITMDPTRLEGMRRQQRSQQMREEMEERRRMMEQQMRGRPNR
jgi:hypothetical protein